MTTDYGVDVATSDDLDVSGVNTSEQRTLAENLIRRLTTPPGLLEYTSGLEELDIREYWSADMGTAELNALGSAIDSVVGSDERVEAVSASAELTDGRLIVSVVVVPVEGKEFTLVIATDSITTDVLSFG